MATTTPVWTENVTLRAASADNLGANSSLTNDIDLDGLGYDLVRLNVEVTFKTGSDKDIVIEVYPSPNSGTKIATQPAQSYILPFVAAASARSISVPIEGMPYAQIKITNPDTADAVTLELIYAGRKWVTV